jgi:hypothetical protein
MIGVYGHRMHDFILRELEIGTRAAMFEDSESCGWSALDDLDYERYMLRTSRASRVGAETGRDARDHNG